MNREIKFRAKPVDSGEWIYGSSPTKLDNGNYLMLNFDKEGRLVATLVQPETVGEYTGLKDKNRVEIYEGDIITNNGVTNDMKRRAFAIEWATDRARWVANDVRANMQTGVLQWDTNNCEVIGNIYQTPELLEKAS